LRSDAGFAVLLFLGALLPRLYVAIAWAREPVWDGHYYHFGATRIAEGLGYSEDVVIDGLKVWKPWCHYPVGYSGFIGLIYKVLGEGLWVAPVVNAFIGAATAVAVFALARHWLSPVRAKLAGTICALHPGLILYTALVMTEPLAALTLVLAGLCTVQFRGAAAWLTAGVVLGLGALVRPPALLALPWLLPALFDDARARLRGIAWSLRHAWPSLGKAALRTAGAGAVALLTIAPWTVRNCRVMDGCALISTNGGWNLAIGAVTETGRFSPLKAEWGCPGPGQAAQDRCWRDFGQATIAADPLAWLSKIPSKLAHTYSHESFAVGYLGEADPGRWTETRKDSWRTTTTVFHNLLMFVATLAAVAVGRGRNEIPTSPGGVARRDLPTNERQAGARRARRALDAWLEPVRQVRLTAGLVVQGGLLVVIGGWTWWALAQPQSPVFWLIVAAPLLALLPLPGAPRRGAVAFYAWGVVLMTSVTHGIFFGDDRYHLTISPLLCMLAAGALRRSDVPDPSPPSPQPDGPLRDN